MRERVEALKWEVETLGDQERQIRLSIAEQRAAVDAKSKETEVSAEIIQLRQDLEQAWHGVARVYQLSFLPVLACSCHLFAVSHISVT